MGRKILFLVIGAVVLIVAFAYLIVMGGPLPASLEAEGCRADYTYFLTDNAYCMKRTHGHCPDNSMMLGNAKRELGVCLCEAYLRDNAALTEGALVKLIESDEFLSGAYSQVQGGLPAVCLDRHQFFHFLMIE